VVVPGATLSYWEMQMLKLGLRLHLNSLMIYLSQEVTHLEVGKTLWATAKAKTVNGERQLQALVDKKKVIITETNIRSDLHLEDVGGTDCLPTATIFEELAGMGPQKKQSRRKQRKETKVPQDETRHDDSVPIPSNDPPLSSEDRMQLTELMILCTNLQK
ncbi:hypothetical protein Tco_1510742, partial [Tanacetum coccineum]